MVERRGALLKETRSVLRSARARRVTWTRARNVIGTAAARGIGEGSSLGWLTKTSGATID